MPKVSEAIAQLTQVLQRSCHKCQIEKNSENFYNYSTGLRKWICKECEKISRDKLWTCPICEITIRSRCRNRHENYSRAHVKCQMKCEPYYKILQPQNRRKYEY